MEKGRWIYEVDEPVKGADGLWSSGYWLIRPDGNSYSHATCEKCATKKQALSRAGFLGNQEAREKNGEPSLLRPAPKVEVKGYKG